MTKLKIVILAVVVVIAAILIVAALRPDAFQVERAVSIKAPPEKIFPYIVDFRNWPAWSPWENLDPSMKRTMSGAASGPGAVYVWEGNSKVGAGRMEITDVSPPREIVIKLDFTEPIEAQDITRFKLEPAGEATNVTWTMSGPSPYITKLMGLFVDMDAMIGKDFETGLANLKAAAEK